MEKYYIFVKRILSRVNNYSYFVGFSFNKEKIKKIIPMQRKIN